MRTLKDRVKITRKGFQVEKDPGTDRTLRYLEYTLQSDPDEKPDGLKEMSYWNIADSNEQEIRSGDAYIYVEEQENGKTVDSTRVYWSKSGNKPEIRVDISAAKPYGKTAYMIKISWPDSKGEPIHPKYMFLKSRRSGDAFHFLKKMIQPMPDLNGEDHYVYIVPENEDPDDYFVDVLPELRFKYRISQE